MGKKGQRNEHGGKVEVGKETPSFGGGKIKEVRSQSIKKFVWILKSLRIMKEGILESMTVTQCGVEMTTTNKQ